MNVIVKNQIQIVENHNEHFVKIRPEHARKLELNPNDDPIKYLNSIDVNHKFSFKIMSEEAMVRFLVMLKGGKTPGPESVSPNLVKDEAKSIVKPLMLILNVSLPKGIVPNVWKLAKITPIFKSGAPNEKNNYRPISALSVSAKLFENIYTLLFCLQT